jgi:hypothetical protein
MRCALGLVLVELSERTLYYGTRGDSGAREPNIFYKVASRECSFVADQI